MAIQNHFMNISLIDNPLKIIHSDSITLLVLGKSDDHRILNEKKRHHSGFQTTSMEDTLN